MTSKSIVTNLGALEAKYGAAGLEKVRAALDKLIAADAAAGSTLGSCRLTTRPR